MTFLTRVDRQFMLRNWISRNLKPIKRFNMYYGDSRILLRLAKENDERLADIDHEEFKQAMARCGFYADTSYTDEHCTMEIEQLERIADALEGISGHLSRLTSCIGSSGAFCIAGDVLVEVDKVK